MAVSYRGQNSQGQDDNSLRIEYVPQFDNSAYDPETGEGAVASVVTWLVAGAYNLSSSAEFDKGTNQYYSQSYFYINPISITGSFYGAFYGNDARVTGSLNVIGTSSFQGPVAISGSLGLSGSLRLDPTDDPGNIFPSSSFLYQSASNNVLGTDLYIRQDGQYVKFNWIAGQQFTGLLYGGVVTYAGNTVYISSGSGIVVDYNAGGSQESVATIQYVTWPNLSFVPTYLAFRQVTYLAIDSGSNVYQSYTPFTDADYSDKVVLGAVGHFDLANVTAFQGSAQTTYDQQNQTNRFIDSFGPLKISGYELTAQPSSFKLSVGSGTSFIHGGFYDYDASSPSTIATSAQATASLAYVYQSGGGGIYFDTNGGAFYTNVTSSKYDDGSGTPATVSNNNWTIQRVYSDPRTGKLYIYYGRTIYATKADALAGLSTDTFSEGDTFDFTTFLGYLVLKSNTTDLSNTTDNSILAGGLFRGISAGGGSSGGGTTSPGGSNTQIQYNNASNFGGVPVLTYDGTTLRGTGSFSGSFTGTLIGTASWATNATTASYILNAVSSSFATSASRAAQAGNTSTIDVNVFGSPVDSYLLMSNVAGTTGVAIGGDADLRYNSSTNVLTVGNVSATTLTGSLLGTASNAVNAISSSFASTASFVQNAVSASFASTASFLNTLNQNLTFNGNLTLNGTASISFLNVSIESASVIYSTGSNQFGDAANDTQTLFGSVVIPTGSLTVTGSTTSTGGFTGSLFGTSSWAVSASQALTASYVPNAVSSSFASTASFVQTAQAAFTASAVVITPTGSSDTFYLTTVLYPGPNKLNQILYVTNSFYYEGNKRQFFAPTFIQTTTGVGFVGSASYAVAALSASSTATASFVATSSWANNAINATTASYVLNAVSSSFTSTASFVNTLNQSVLISGSLTVGTSSIGPSENTVTLGARDNGSEGGQLGLNAPGGTYTSASMIDNYANFFRILRGSNAGSDALVAQWNLHTKQMQLPAYTNTNSFPGSAAAFLAVDSSGNLITTSSAGGGGSVTINNNVDNYLITATGTLNTLNGESNLQFNGTSLTVTGQITSSGAITSQANGAMYFRGGDDAEFWDINVANTVGIYGQQNQDRAGLKLGSSGATLFGTASRFGIGTTAPVATLDVNGSLYVASGITGSLFGTASFATSASFAVSSSRAVSSSFAISASWAPSVASNPFPFTGSALITGSLGITGSTSIQGKLLHGVSVAASVGLFAHAQGFGSTANGDYSHAEGFLAATLGTYSHAEGQGTTTIGICSHAEGQSTITQGDNSHAEGEGTLAIGIASHAEGQSTTASADYSHAEGNSTQTVSTYQHAQGQFNLPTSGSGAFIIGNGTAGNARSNLVFASGSQFQITGSLIVSGTYGGINTFTNKPALYDSNNIARVVWGQGALVDASNSSSVDWQTRYLQDSAETTKVDWQNGTLNDSTGAPSVDWENRTLSEPTTTWVAFEYSNAVATTSQLYHRATIPGQVQRSIAETPIYAGQLIQATINVGVTDYQLVFLDTDGTWKGTKATVANGATKMLGIAVDTAGGYVLIEGDVGVSDDNSQGGYVVGADHGLPVYVSGNTGEMTTTAPSGVGELVRIVGHIYYQSTTDTNWWTMKFRPSNDWYEQ